MKYPPMVESYKSRDNQTAFYGYNHNLIIGPNEFYDMKNLTGDFCPVLSPRKERARININLKNPQGLIAKDSLGWVDDNKFYYGNPDKPVAVLQELNVDRQMISNGAYIVIFPDAVRYNTSTGEFEELGAKWEQTQSITFELCKLDAEAITAEGRELTDKPEEAENGDWWLDLSGELPTLKCFSEATNEWAAVATTYVKVSSEGIDEKFELYDAVEINEAIEEAGIDKGSYPIWAKGDGYIVITAMLKEGRYVIEPSEDKEKMTVERKIPKLDYVCECNNRIWGCRWDGTINEIYSAAQGDPKNWTKYLGTTQDSYFLPVGSDGRFTGIAVQNGTVLFFKENFIHKLYGSKPSNFQTSDIMGRGIKLGCGKSAVVANETLYYLSKNGICQYGGGTPSGIYAPFGGVVYSDAVGGKCGDKYYVSMKDRSGTYSLFCFDEALQMWFKEDDTQVKFFAEDKGILYFINGDNELWVTDAENYDGEFEIAETEGLFEWYAETGDIGIQEPDCKRYSDIQIRLYMEQGSEVAVYLQYDSDGNWHQEALWKDKAKGAYTIPISTSKVDHMKIRIEGKGNAKIYSISKRFEPCSEVRGNEY